MFNGAEKHLSLKLGSMSRFLLKNFLGSNLCCLATVIPDLMLYTISGCERTRYLVQCKLVFGTDFEFWTDYERSRLESWSPKRCELLYQSDFERDSVLVEREKLVVISYTA